MWLPLWMTMSPLTLCGSETLHLHFKMLDIQVSRAAYFSTPPFQPRPG